MTTTYLRRGETPWAGVVDLVPNVGDERHAAFGAYAVRGTGSVATRYVHLRRESAEVIRVGLFGARIATITPGAVRLWARGYGHSPTTRDALSAVSFGRGFVHSSRRRLMAGGAPFREGITFTADRSMIDGGEGDPVAGAPARRTR